MKRVIIFAAAIACFSFTVKKIKDQKYFQPQEREILVVSVDALYAEDDPCLGHGGTVGIGREWNIATRRSDCERGIGFRCGHTDYVRCKDGTKIPIRASEAEFNRAMNGDYTFYSDSTLKITFLNSLPESEAENNVFEVEGDETIVLPTYILIDGRKYSSLIIRSGNYEINRSEGEYGTVTVRYGLSE